MASTVVNNNTAMAIAESATSWIRKSRSASPRN
jgi:hypothetical protein